MLRSIRFFIQSLLFVLLFPSSIFAAEIVFYGEPFIGFANQKVKIKVPVLGEYSTNINQLSAGMNLGWSVDYVHLMVGAGANHNFDHTAGEGGQWNLGVGAGWEWNVPIMTTIFFRNIGGYSTNGESVSDLNFIFVELGLSYFIREDIKANLAYSTLSKTIDSAEIKMDQIKLTLSFPFDFNYPSQWWRLNKGHQR